jgi:hypothetical protein
MYMKKSLVFFLKLLVVLVAICTLVFMLWEPNLEGRNINATLFEVYFKDPFLAYAYIASIPFFMALYTIFKVLGYAGGNDLFSLKALKALRTIKYCMTTVIGFVAIGEIFIMLNESDDRAGGVFMGILVTLGSIIIAAVAARFEKSIQNTKEIKSE